MKILHCLALALLATLALQPTLAHADTDAAGCKDSPLITRFPGSVISSCDKKDFDGYNFTVTVDKKDITKRIEGDYTQVQYNYPKDRQQDPGRPQPQ